MDHAVHDGELALADLLDRALHKGVVLWGEATISLAGVELVYIGLKLLVASFDTAERIRAAQKERLGFDSSAGG